MIVIKIFVDSADIDEIKAAASYGILDGVTTNPSLIKKALDTHKHVDMKAYIKQIITTAKGKPVSLEVISDNADEMLAQAKTLLKTFNASKNVVIKIPIVPSYEHMYDGLSCIKKLTKQGIPVNCTLVMTPEQALLAAKSGATYISPFAGRIDDFIRANNNIEFDKSDYFSKEGIKVEGWRTLEDNGIVSGIQLVKECVQIMRTYNFKSKIIASSIRNPRQARDAALAGADIATIPFSVISKLLEHQKTKEGAEKFLQDTVKEYSDLF